MSGPYASGHWALTHGGVPQIYGLQRCVWLPPMQPGHIAIDKLPITSDSIGRIVCGQMR